MTVYLDGIKPSGAGVSAGLGITKPPFSVSGIQWMIPGWGGTPLAQMASDHPIDILVYVPIYVARSMTFDRIAVSVAVAGGGGAITRLGIYEFNMTNSLPGALILDAGTLDVTSTGTKAITINQTLSQGYYYLAIIKGVAEALHQGLNQNYGGPVTPVGASGFADGFADVVPNIGSQTNVATNGLPDPAPIPTSSSPRRVVSAMLRKAV